MEGLLFVIILVALPGFAVGYSKSAKKYPQIGVRIFIGLLCAVAFLLLIAAIFFGACLCMMGGNLRLN